MLTVLALFLCSHLNTPSAIASRGDVLDVVMFLELNETDQDAEVVMEINSADPLLFLAVFGPTGLFSFLNLVDPGRIGQSEILLESGEPSIREVLDAYPEGRYLFFAFTISGRFLSTQIDFTHDLIEAPFFHPCDGAVVDPDQDLLVQWAAREGAESYVLEIGNEDAGIELFVTVPASITSYRVPHEILIPESEYEIGVGVKTDRGNFSVLEGTFFTRSGR